MLVLGLSGGVDSIHSNQFELANEFAHDAAAVLVEDGVVVAAFEEERLNRIKHTNKAAARAVRACLARRGVGIEAIDKIAYYSTRAYLDGFLSELALARPELPAGRDACGLLAGIFADEFGLRIPDERFAFVHHHQAHAISAYHLSGFGDALVLTLDSEGDGVSGMAFRGTGGQLEPMRSWGLAQSLGKLYWGVTRVLGYRMFDEYKVMGLAPYGDPKVFGQAMARLYELREGGEYHLHLDRIGELLEYLPPRRKSEPFSQPYKDLAASLQVALETIVTHVAYGLAEKCGAANLVLAGGVAHNCTMVGRLYDEARFAGIFVQPAAHDAGCALGAALSAFVPKTPEPLPHVFWGSDIGGDAAIRSTLRGYGDVLEFEAPADIYGRSAELLAQGAVIGWVQGRSEFGPRALGHRSIVADPRPAENKNRINAMVKKREGYRPFAPAVLAERAESWFELRADATCLEFMNVVVSVRPEKRAELAATTHVDGSSRIQTVDAERNPHFYQLIAAFEARTGIPVLLNTSFNNDVEPIVESVDDAVAAYLTTQLDYLVVGGQLVRKLENMPDGAYDQLKLDLAPAVELQHHRQPVGEGLWLDDYALAFNWRSGRRHVIDAATFAVLCASTSTDAEVQSLGVALQAVAEVQRAAARAEILELWSRRFVTLRGRAG